MTMQFSVSQNTHMRVLVFMSFSVKNTHMRVFTIDIIQNSHMQVFTIDWTDAYI